MIQILLAISIVDFSIWLFLLFFWGQFWRADQRIRGEKIPGDLDSYPPVSIIVPARDEAAALPASLKSLLNQDYPGAFKIILVDDRSRDRTGEIAREIADTLNQSQRLTVISGQPLPTGWTGKLWAMEQGIEEAKAQSPPPGYFLLTDADIEHQRTNLRQLVAKAEREDLALTSLMVLLRCESFWERLLIPAFVFFFQKLYPFRWVNDPQNKMAAAAGGCILIRRESLNQIGGIQVLREALIDDCTLAQKVKSSRVNSQPTAIWLGLTASTKSLRPYPSLKSIWDMVARTAYTQLNYSPWLLLATAIAMGLVYLSPPMSVAVGAWLGHGWMLGLGLTTWLLMAVAYFPTLRLYSVSAALAFSLPAIAFLYTLMTVDSAWRHYRGRGGAWKGRVYPSPGGGQEKNV